MQNSFTEVSRQGWGSRLMGSIKSVLFGFLLFLASFVVLWWNEGRAVHTARGLEEGAGVVVHVDAANVDTSNDGKLIHLNGKVSTTEQLTDADFGVNVSALKLRRKVEMFQWKQEENSKTEKKVGGAEETTTTYSYKTVWSGGLISSNNFKIPEGHQNPSAFPVQENSIDAQHVTVGGFQLSPSLLSDINTFVSVPVTDENKGSYKHASINGNIIYIGTGSMTNPMVGDVKVSFEAVMPGDYSIIAKQVSSTFEPYRTKEGTTIEMVESGVVSAESMFATAERNNTIMTWLLRGVGFFMMFFGLGAIFRPLVVVADVLPFLGSLLGMGVSLFAGIISFSLSLVTIAVAWIAYRPILGVSLLVIGGGIFVFFYMRAKKKKEMLATQKVPVGS